MNSSKALAYSKQAVCAMCSCIPVRVSEVNGKVDVSVLMITSRGGKDLVFPKVAIAQNVHHDTPVFIQLLCVSACLQYSA